MVPPLWKAIILASWAQTFFLRMRIWSPEEDLMPESFYAVFGIGLSLTALYYWFKWFKEKK